MALPNKTSHELIYKPNTKGPWSDTRGPGIGALSPWSNRSNVAIRYSNPLDTENCRVEWLKAQATLIRNSPVAADGRS